MVFKTWSKNSKAFYSEDKNNMQSEFQRYFARIKFLRWGILRYFASILYCGTVQNPQNIILANINPLKVSSVTAQDNQIVNLDL